MNNDGLVNSNRFRSTLDKIKSKWIKNRHITISYPVSIFSRSEFRCMKTEKEKRKKKNHWSWAIYSLSIRKISFTSFNDFHRLFKDKFVMWHTYLIGLISSVDIIFFQVPSNDLRFFYYSKQSFFFSFFFFISLIKIETIYANYTTIVVMIVV
jgi:hypothetical protein